MHAPQSLPILSRIAAVALGILLLSACGGEMRVPGVYRIDIQQGNVITQEQLAALESGMEKRKVRFILGTPLIADTFNQQRWDYYYSFEEGGGDKVQRIISVYFEDDLLARVSGDVRAASGPIELPARMDKVVTVPDGYRDRGLFDSLTPDFLSDRPKRRVVEDAAKEATEQTAEQAEEQAGAETESAASEATDAAQDAVESAADSTSDAASDAPIDTASDDATSEVPSDAPPTTVDLDADDERYLGNLLGGLGREGDGSTAPQNSVAPTAEATQAATEQSEEQGLLSRWAGRFGFGKKDPSDEDATDDEPQQLIEREIN